MARCIAVFGIGFNGLKHYFFKFHVHFRRDLSGFFCKKTFGKVFLAFDHCFGAFVFYRKGPDKHLEKDDAHRINVRSRIGHCARRLFRRHIERRSDDLALRQVFRGKYARYPEVGDKGPFRAGFKIYLPAYVLVDNATFVGKTKAVEDLGDNVKGFRKRDQPLEGKGWLRLRLIMPKSPPSTSCITWK